MLHRFASHAPDVVLVIGAVAFGIGVWEFDPRAEWLYAGACVMWLAFAMGTTENTK